MTPSVSGLTKLNLTTRETIEVLRSPRIFQRLRHHGWLKPLETSRDALYPVSRVIAAQLRMEGGEMPPLLPCEVKARAKRLRGRAA